MHLTMMKFDLVLQMAAIDGEADAIFFMINQRHLVADKTQFEAKSVSKIKLIVIQCKTSGGFKPTEIEKWLEFTDDFLDLSKSPKGFGTRYNSRVVGHMELWKEQYIKASSAFPSLGVEYFYITGDDATPDSYVEDSAKRVRERVAKHLKAQCDVHFVGAKQLWEQVQKRPPKSKLLKWSEQPMQTSEGYVGLVRLTDFFEFLEDSPGELAERIFESNVRGYLIDTPVNEQIKETLKSGGKGNFWLVNNGVTIISPQAIPAGHLLLTINDPQIVNGLQTSREIFSYFLDGALPNEGRTILVRVIQTDDAELQDTIIRATNSQNRMQAAALRMTDPIHRDIEAMFKKFDLYYDRRKGHYRDQGKPIDKIVSVTEVVQAVVSIILQRPNDARARPSDYFKDDDSYKTVFANQGIAIDAYVTCTVLLRKVDEFLDTQDLENIEQRNIKFYVAAMLARELTGLAKPIAAKLPSFSTIPAIDGKLIIEVYRRVKRTFDRLTKTSDKDTVGRGPLLLKNLNIQHKKRMAVKVKDKLK